MELTFTGKPPHNPKDRILAIEAAAKAICQSINQDPADATMCLLTAAVHTAMKYAIPGTDIQDLMANSLFEAITCAQGFFPTEKVPQ